MVDPFSYFLFQPVLYDWCNKGCMCYPVCVMMHIRELLLLIGKSSPYGSSGFPLSLSEWSCTIYLTPYNSKYKNVLSVLLNKTLPSFLPGLNNLLVIGLAMAPSMTAKNLVFSCALLYNEDIKESRNNIAQIIFCTVFKTVIFMFGLATNTI